MERVHSQDPVPDRFERGHRSVAAISLADAGNAVGGFQFDDGAKGVGGVKTVRTTEWSVRDRYRMQKEFRNDHAGAIRVCRLPWKFYSLMKVFPFLLTAALAAQAPTPESNKAAIATGLADIETSLTEITGLKFHKEVPYAVIDKQQLHKFLEERMRDAVKPEEIHAEETMLKMFGFLPAEYDLKKATIELLTEQAAAFYDYHKKKLFILETSDSTPDLHTESEKMALSHELGHALADQEFHLDKFIKDGTRSDDGSTARLAVMEGQASWLMTAYVSKLSTGQAAVPPGVLELMSQAVENSASQYPVFAKAPLYLRESLVFPYTSGMLFQNAIYQKLGKQAFSEVFLHPPDSTQQIMHPEKYLSHVAPDIPALPALPHPKQFRKIGDGTLGEFDFGVMLSQYVSKAESEWLSQHISGSTYELVETKKDRHPVLAWSANWDTADSAAKFLHDYRKIMSAKSKECQFDDEKDGALSGHNEYGIFRATATGKRFESVEGMPAQVN
jgi:hypothetical protein